LHQRLPRTFCINNLVRADAGWAEPAANAHAPKSLKAYPAIK
jgi:hypothetical protein